MTMHEEKRQPNSHEDSERTNAARAHAGSDPLNQLPSKDDGSSDDWNTRDKNHTLTGRTSRTPMNSDESPMGGKEEGQNRDKEHTTNFRGETASGKPHTRHTGKGRHTGGDNDPGFGATDRG